LRLKTEDSRTGYCKTASEEGVLLAPLSRRARVVEKGRGRCARQCCGRGERRLTAAAAAAHREAVATTAGQPPTMPDCARRKRRSGADGTCGVAIRRIVGGFVRRPASSPIIKLIVRDFATTLFFSLVTRMEEDPNSSMVVHIHVPVHNGHPAKQLLLVLRPLWTMENKQFPDQKRSK
jgi:hypothetical protein